jgi:hypothetical protein
LPELAPCEFYLFPQLKIPPFWYNWVDQVTVGGSAVRPHRTRLPGCI